MTRTWDYKTVHINQLYQASASGISRTILGVGEMKLRLEDIAGILTGHGNDGWELVNVVRLENRDGDLESLLCFFKRER